MGSYLWMGNGEFGGDTGEHGLYLQISVDFSRTRSRPMSIRGYFLAKFTQSSVTSGTLATELRSL